jgi:prefoldin subunit 5
MTNYAKVEGHPNLIRDLKTNAIINTDKISLDHYSIIKRKKEEEQKRIDNIEDDLNELKSSIDEIKQLLRSFTNGSK